MARVRNRSELTASTMGSAGRRQWMTFPQLSVPVTVPRIQYALAENEAGDNAMTLDYRSRISWLFPE